LAVHPLSIGAPSRPRAR